LIWFQFLLELGRPVARDFLPRAPPAAPQPFVVKKQNWLALLPGHNKVPRRC
jgi:hypothetical protein